MKIAYFVHNVEDAAVLRRMQLLRLGGATIRLVGFKRFASAKAVEEPSNALVLGRTYDAKFTQRIFAVIGCILWPFTLIGVVRASDIIVCRNLEMLVLGYVIRLMSASKAPLNYECLDINRKMLGAGKGARILRRAEAFLLARCNAVITSSPAFVHNYFEPLQRYGGRVCLIENKLLPKMGREISVVEPPRAPSWIIGWFGIIRCRKSLALLRALTEKVPGIEVIIAGRVAHHEFADFDTEISASRNIRFTGPYSLSDLAQLYGQVHFVWAIDYFEEGENSAWLLPNRLYDSLAFGRVPIALNSVETGRWLNSHRTGLVINSPLDDLPDMLARMTEAKYAELRRTALEVASEDLIHSATSAKDLVSCIQ